MRETGVDREDGVARLRLIRTAGIGPVTYAQLLTRFPTPQAALDAVPELARRGGGKAPAIASVAAVEQEIEVVAKLGAKYLFRGRGLYPSLLEEVETAPPVLIVRGDQRLLDRRIVAIVGARNASAAAARFSRQLAAELGRGEIVVASGLARGIDTAAHEGSIDSGTIAVVAGGIDIAYPPENVTLQQAIAEHGLLVSEQPPGVEPRARHFPYRNRIIAGIALGTVVMEAAPKSGSLITARNAADFGREVMAIPGSPLDPRAQGCNQLIREGATLVQNAADVIEAIGGISGHRMAVPQRSYGKAQVSSDADEASRRTIANLLGPTAVPVDELIRQTGIAPAIVHTILLELELGGRLQRHAGAAVSLI